MAAMPKLKKTVSDLRAEARQRIASRQGGVSTFFDNFMEKTLTMLEESESCHHWDPNLETADPEISLRVGQLRWLEAYASRRARGQLVSFSERKRWNYAASDVPPRVLILSQGAPNCLTWKGLPLFKTAYDFALMPMILWAIKPGTVLEIGSGRGGSAIWMADLLRAQANPARVYTVDINPIDLQDPQIAFLRGDCAKPEQLFPIDVLEASPHPWLIIEDAHVNVGGVLGYLDQFTVAGDYLIVEDSYGKVEAISSFLETRQTRYLVDTSYTDFFGRNATCAPDSIFRRI